jgi:uncharacterized protein YtpQ (UPF0354 family)
MPEPVTLRAQLHSTTVNTHKHKNKSSTPTTRATQQESKHGGLVSKDKTPTTVEHTGALILVKDAVVPVMTPAQFTQEVVAALQRADPGAQVQIVEDLQLKHTHYEISLANVYDEYSLDPTKKTDIISNQVSGVLEATNIDSGATIDRSCIVPVLHATSWLEDNIKADDPKQQAHQSITADLVVGYGVDRPRTITYLRNKGLADLNLSVDELHRIAVTNLKRLLPAPTIPEQAGIHRIRCGGTYEPSMIFLDEFWEKLPFTVPGEVVVAVPASGCLYVTGSERPGCIERLHVLAHEVAATYPHAISPGLLVRRLGKFIQYSVDLPPVSIVQRYHPQGNEPRKGHSRKQS